MLRNQPRAAYVHVPFCRHRCGYCDFPLITGRDDLIGDYLSALERELQTLEEPCEVETLFFGGGTPTHLSPEQMRRMFALVDDWLPLADGAEFSVEANPNDLDAERIGVLVDAGVNRMSLGVQSFEPAALTVLERDHSSDDVLQALDRLWGMSIRNLSIDLIFGVPGQSLDEWTRAIDLLGSLPIQHVSTYGLTYEKGTSFWRRRDSGGLREMAEETERQMYAAAMDLLPQSGFAQYEISSFAKADYACRHNQVYWRGDPYFGFGPGAARYLDGVRSTNHRSVTTWLKRVQNGQSAVGDTETLDAEARARELIMLGLRRTSGIEIDTFHEQTGFSLNELGGDAIARFCAEGLLEETDGHLRLSHEGRFFADTVMVEFL